MAIYNRKSLSNSKEWIFGLECVITDEMIHVLKEFPNFELKDDDNITKLNYRLKCDRDLSHGPRINVLQTNPNLKSEISMNINKDGSITLEKSKIGNNSMVIARQYAVIAGGFAKYAVKEIYDAYYTDNYDRSKMNRKIKEYNSFNKKKRKEYIKIAKSELKVKEN